MLRSVLLGEISTKVHNHRRFWNDFTCKAVPKVNKIRTHKLTARELSKANISLQLITYCYIYQLASHKNVGFTWKRSPIIHRPFSPAIASPMFLYRHLFQWISWTCWQLKIVYLENFAYNQTQLAFEMLLREIWQKLEFEAYRVVKQNRRCLNSSKVPCKLMLSFR